MKKKASKKITKPTATHRIYIKRSGFTDLWNWNTIRVENGEVICFSNQGHERKIDAREAIRKFLAAAKNGTVEIVE